MKIDIPYLNLEQIAESGQCFRWKRIDENTYRIPGESGNSYSRGRDLIISQKGSSFELSCSQDEWEKQWFDYFDMNTDYAAIEERIRSSGDEHAIKAFEEGNGIRILKQNLWEMIVSFLISQNNNIKRITASVQAICDLNSGIFPRPGEIDVECFEERGLGLGYRVPYLKEIYSYVNENPEWLELLRSLSYEEAFEELRKRKGIGPKVANCICLFGLHHVEAFPIDTHVKQLLEKYYADGFDFDYYNGVAGIIQQYLFYYELKN